MMKENKLKAVVGKEIIFVEDLHLQRVALISWQKVLWESDPIFFFRKTYVIFLPLIIGPYSVIFQSF